MDDLEHYAFPEIQRQIQLPLSMPTPPAERALQPSREQLNRDALSTTLRALREAGANADVPDDVEA
jgi:hypothetical protein